MMTLVHTQTTKMLKTLKQGNICLDLKTFCKKIEPFVVYYRKLINIIQ